MTLSATARGAGSRNTGGESTYVISPSGTIAAGSRAVLCLATDNSGVGGIRPTPVSFTDSVGNFWRRRNQATQSPGGVANDGTHVTIYDCCLATALTALDTITIALDAVTVARAYALWELTTDIAGMIVVPIAGGAAGVGASTTPSVITTQPLATGEMVIGAMAAEQGNGTMTVDTDATSGSWSTAQNANVGAGAAGIELSTQNKLVTGPGNQTFNQTITSSDWASVAMPYTEGKLAALSAGGGSRNTGGESTYDIASGANRVGDFLVLCLAYDNSGTNGADPFSSITDDVGNAWTTDAVLRDPGVASDGVVVRVCSCLVTAPSTLITVSFGGFTTVARAYALWYLDAAPGRVPAYGGAPDVAGGASTTPSVTKAAVPNGALVIGAVGIEHGSPAITVDTDTTSGSWSTARTQSVGVTTSGVTIVSQAKTVRATGDQTYNLTITSADWAEFVGFYYSSINVPIGQAIESDVGQPVSPAKALVLGLVVEIDDANAVAILKRLTLGEALEVDAGQPLTFSKLVVLGLAAELGEAFAVEMLKALDLGEALEVDDATPVSPAKALVLAEALEADAGEPFTFAKLVELGGAVEADVVELVSFARALVLGEAVEVDAGQPFTMTKSMLLGQALEQDLAFVIVTSGGVDRDIIMIVGALQRMRSAWLAARRSAADLQRRRSSPALRERRTAGVLERERSENQLTR